MPHPHTLIQYDRVNVPQGLNLKEVVGLIVRLSRPLHSAVDVGEEDLMEGRPHHGKQRLIA